MRDHFSIWIVSPEGLVWSHVFDEVALGLQSAFRDLGYAAPIVTDPQDIIGTALVLGANLCPMYDIEIPKDSIIYNLEQVHPGSRWFAKDYGYVALMKRHAVWDFSRRNISELQKLGVDPVVHCPVGYAGELTRAGGGKQDVDVLFIGGGHPRRQVVLDDIGKRGARLQTLYKIFGRERDQWMGRGKIHLNMHKEPAELFEIVRCSYLLANKCFVISEPGQDKELEAPFAGGIVFAPYENLAQTCLEYLVKPKERKAIAAAGFEQFRKMKQTDYLDAALAHYHSVQKKRPVVSSAAKIFVAIASFRDPEIQATISDLFRRAAQPERLRVGVCLQTSPEDAGCEVDETRYPGQVKVVRVPFAQSRGANWARVKAFELMDGEEFVLLVDSHMRFVDGWDDALVDMIGKCPADKPVISCYLPNYDPPNHRFHHRGEFLRTRIRKLGRADEAQMVHISGQLVADGDEDRSGLYPTPFAVANFLFGKASMVRDVPIDPNIHFWGDEINYAARLWTHGYDIFQADRVLAYHYWVRKDQFKLHDYREEKTDENRASGERVRQLLGFGRMRDEQINFRPYGLGSERKLDDLWAFAGIDWDKRTITDFAEEGIWNMAAREKGRGVSKPIAVQHPRIFVQIASYRDPQCQWTVKDLFAKATRPERINVGICWQFVKDEDAICFTEPYPFPDQVKVLEIDARESQGVCWARGLTQKMWDGEEFTLQIDSHMRFEQGWDEMLLQMLKQCDDPDAVLTCYAPGFTPPDKLEKDWIFGMSAKEFDVHGIFLMTGAPGFAVKDGLPMAPFPGAYASANMLFGPSRMIADVPYDPHLYFFGEEITMAVRLWTHGYNIYHPNRLVIYHDWNRDKRPTHFSDHKDWGVQNDKSFARVKHMLGTDNCPDPEVLRELDIYGLGSKRSLAAYQEYAGVDFKRKLIAQHALQGQFPRDKTLAKKATVSLSEGHNEMVTAKKDGRIFINIASYRDPECQWTVKDLFEKASNPDKIFVGICWQFDPEEDKHCFEVTTRPEQVRILPVDWREAEGVCWARHQAQQLWDGEEYTLMIDSHMRFMQGWDEAMIAELATCDSAKPVLSMSPVGYLPPDKLGKRLNPTVRRAKPFQPDGNIRCQGEMLDRAPEKPLRGAFLVANFIFSRSEITPEVPYDPYLYFDQEEISYAARLYTHGWDIFSCTRQFLYHYYNDLAAPGGSVRPLHWRDLHKEDNARIRHMRERGLRRFNHLTGYQQAREAETLTDIAKYGFGRVRTLAQFEQYSGVDFKHKIASEKALRCLFIENLSKYRDRPIHVPELDEKKQNAQQPIGATQGGAALAMQPQQAVQRQPQFIPVVQPRAAAAAQKLLEVGDYMPMFETHDTEKRLRTIENHAGKFCLLMYFPSAQPEAAAKFYHELQERLEKAGLKDIWQTIITDDTMERANRFREMFKVSLPLCLDPERRIVRSLGIAKQGAQVPFAAFVLDTNLKITHVHVQAEPGVMAAMLVNDLALEMATFKQNNQSQIIRRAAPALMVPQVFTPEFCAKCIRAFRTGNTFDGTVGSKENKVYRADVKVRTDYIVNGELLEEIDDKFSRSFFPEIKKVFGFEVTHREIYKIGLYTGEKGGFFKQHRDNFDYPMAYRRVASTIHLNDDYEGGGVRFPEYGDDIYRPTAGSAVAFSASTLHEALPVTKGERFILVAFVHGNEDEAYRRHYLMGKGEVVKPEDYTPKGRQYPELRQSRWFYKDWLEKNARYDASSVPANVPANTSVQAPIPAAANVNQPEPKLVTATPHIMIGNTAHQPKKMFESKDGIVFDDFLPEDVYQRLLGWVQMADYEYINTQGKVTRAWHLHDGFPLRSSQNFFYHAKWAEPQKPEHIYPMKNDVDAFMEAILAIQPQVEHLVGRQNEEWAHFSVTGWLYPHGTGLAMHDDGSGVYTGAYTFFMNPTWRAHWGGLLLLVDQEANHKVQEYRRQNDQMEFYKRKFLHTGGLDELLLEHGMAKCIFPKGNRMVFIANESYHMITRVNEQSGDNIRTSLAGFFNRKR